MKKAEGYFNNIYNCCCLFIDNKECYNTSCEAGHIVDCRKFKYCPYDPEINPASCKIHYCIDNIEEM